MPTTKFYLDTRRAGDANHALRINICQKTKTAAFNLGIRLTKEQWNVKAQKVENHPDAKYINNVISKRKVEVDTILLKLEDTEPQKAATMTAVELRDYVQKVLNPEEVTEEKPKEEKKPKKLKENPNSVEKYFIRYCEHKDISKRTKELYQTTWRRIIAWLGEEQAKKLDFKDINLAWIEDYDEFLGLTAPSFNSRRIHHANLKAVINYAIDHEVLDKTPYRRYKIKTQPTAKRSMTVEQLRYIIFAQDLEPWMERHRDFFVLSFMLRGLNTVDLCHMTKPIKGRVDWLRTKTAQPLSLKIEPEMEVLIDKHAGKERMLNVAEGRHYRNYNNRLSGGLKGIRKLINERIKGEGEELPEFTMYWARHTWATIAHRLGFPIDVIGRGLGHSQKTVTEIYLDPDPTQIDRVNRTVLDYVLYGIDPREPAPAPEKKKRGRPKKNS